MPARWLSLLFAPFWSACVAYVEDPVDLSRIAAEVRSTGGPLTLDAAMLAALSNNPELLRLEALARAAGAVTQPLEVTAEYGSEREMLAVMLDPVALLKLGPRGGAATVDDAVAATALAELAEARWRLTAAVAETFLLDRALERLQLPAFDIDGEKFERAGLASSASAHRLRAARLRLDTEAKELTQLREQNRSSLRRLLGLDRSADVRFVHTSTSDLRQPAGDDRALLSRPDLLLQVVRFDEADAEFRSAVAAQYPSLMLGPEIPVTGGPLEAMAVLRLPFGMAGRAEAAQRRREAARHALLGAWVAASNDADDAEHSLAAATAMSIAAAANLDASQFALETAKTALQVEVDAFDRAAEAATMLVRDVAERRSAVVAEVRAEIRRAMAFGWPRSDGQVQP